MSERPVILVTPEQLPLHCPPLGQPLWSQHPRVFLDLSHGKSEAHCPYCGATYRLAHGAH
ncbi:MAG: zinc-finger domain-containing protein [Betaproteobacteria bacterium]|jgi:uncharacterized Zn-finger protein|nr:MAG: zinc-finger domain-containing protein [Betaproteobacteria bacterium]